LGVAAEARFGDFRQLDSRLSEFCRQKQTRSVARLVAWSDRSRRAAARSWVVSTARAHIQRGRDAAMGVLFIEVR
jgi:hypothetical protein